MRRTLSAIVWLIVALMADICAASAQQPSRVYKIGWLWIGRPGLVQPPMETWTGPPAVFRDTLRDRGYVLGKNLVVEARHAQGDVTRLATEAEALVSSGVDVIVTAGTSTTRAAMQATKRVPIVFAGMQNPVGKGIVASLARPGGNVTGMAVQIATVKGFQLLRDIAPRARRAGWLTYGPNLTAQDLSDAKGHLGVAASANGFELTHMVVTAADELESTIAGFAAGGDGGIVVSSDPTLLQWRRSVLEIALRNRLATVCDEPAWALSGCLITYGEDADVRFRRAAELVDKVLKGANPADIPVEQPTDFKLFINGATAKAIGLTVPMSLLAVADEVID